MGDMKAYIFKSMRAAAATTRGSFYILNHTLIENNNINVELKL